MKLNLLKKMNKKGFKIDAVPQLAIMLVVIAVILGIGLTVLGSMQESSNCDYTYSAATNDCFQCSDGTANASDGTCKNSTGDGATITAWKTSEQNLAWNVTGEGESALDDLSDWQTTWAVIIAAAVVIGIISSYLMFKRTR